MVTVAWARCAAAPAGPAINARIMARTPRERDRFMVIVDIVDASCYLCITKYRGNRDTMVSVASDFEKGCCTSSMLAVCWRATHAPRARTCLRSARRLRQSIRGTGPRLTATILPANVWIKLVGLYHALWALSTPPNRDLRPHRPRHRFQTFAARNSRRVACPPLPPGRR